MITIRFHLLFGVFDLIAKAPALNTKQWEEWLPYILVKVDNASMFIFQDLLKQWPLHDFSHVPRSIENIDSIGKLANSGIGFFITLFLYL